MDSKNKINKIMDKIMKKFGIDEEYNILGFKPIDIARNKISSLKTEDADEIISDIKKIVNE